MAENQENNDDNVHESFSAPPLDHLRPADSAPITLAVSGGMVIFVMCVIYVVYGMVIFVYGVVIEPGAEAEDENEAIENEEEKGEDVACTKKQEKLIQKMMKDVKLMFPYVKEEWLFRLLKEAMIRDKWNIDQTINWLCENENLAPRELKILAHGPLVRRIDDYESVRKMLKEMKHEASDQYKYFAEVKLAQKFPQFGVDDLQLILKDCDHMYPLAVLNIMEGLEQAMQTNKCSLNDWDMVELIYILMEKDGEWSMYPLKIVKQNTSWWKKKVKMMECPTVLANEVRLVERTLAAYEMRFQKIRVQLDTQAARLAQQQTAIAAALGSALECPICSDQYLPEKHISCSDGHEFCVKCLQDAVKESVVGNVQLSPAGELMCFAESCNGVFPLVMLCHMLPPQSMAAFEQRLWTDFLVKGNIPNLFKCPKCGYSEKVEAPIEEEKKFTCKNPNCGHQSCRQCRNVWEDHTERGCKEMQEDPETVLRRKYDEMVSDITVRRCIHCKQPQMKYDQLKLTCQTCSTKMCFLCRKPIEGYGHFCSCGTDPSLPCPCGKCKLYESFDDGDSKVREKLERPLQDELVELKLKMSTAYDALVSKMTGTAVASSSPAIAGAPHLDLSTFRCCLKCRRSNANSPPSPVRRET